MIKPVISIMTAVSVLFGTASFGVSAETNVCTVNFLDFDGNVYYSLTVPEGQQIDKQIISQIDTSKLRKQIGTRSQQWFSEWWGIPEYITGNTDIKPLSVTGTISLEKVPDKHKYYSKDSEIYKDGLIVDITLVTQTGLDTKGNYTTKSEIVDISSTCTLNPKTAGEAFKSGNKAVVNIFPINSDQPIGNYEIIYIDGIGDVNEDKIVTGSDATEVLNAYTMLSSNPSYKVDEAIMLYGDMNFDGILNGSDATMLLQYYTMLSSDPTYNLDKFFSDMNMKNAL